MKSETQSRFGIHTVVYASIEKNGDALSCLLPGRAPIQTNQVTEIGLNLIGCHLFDENGDAFERNIELSEIDESLLTYE